VTFPTEKRIKSEVFIDGMAALYIGEPTWIRNRTERGSERQSSLVGVE